MLLLPPLVAPLVLPLYTPLAALPLLVSSALLLSFWLCKDEMMKERAMAVPIYRYEFTIPYN